MQIPGKRFSRTASLDDLSFQTIDIPIFPRRSNRLLPKHAPPAKPGKRSRTASLDDLSVQAMDTPIYPRRSNRLLAKNLPKCPFCGVPHNLDEKGWLNHLSWHTGELYYRCSACKQRVTTKDEHLNQDCRSNSSAEPIHIDAVIVDEGIYGYICIYCQVVKLSRGLVVKHIIQEHSITNVSDKDINESLLVKLTR